MCRMLVGVLSLALCAAAAARGAGPTPLVLETKIPLNGVKERIDHLAIDVAEQRLFVAALGDDTVEVVDLAGGKVARRLTGLARPQGIAYSPRTQTLYVANAGDGSLRMFRGRDLTPTGRADLGEDADNVRLDQGSQRVYVGYGGGALAVIDEAAQRQVANIPLKAHPEGFQLEQSGPRIFVSVPIAHEIAVVDRRTGAQVASWPTKDLRRNFPLALDEPNKRLVTAFRQPTTLALYDLDSGAEIMRAGTCGDADDVFVDSRRGYVYVSCGEGFIDVWADRPAGVDHVTRVKTVPGARTALFSPELQKLFVAARAAAGQPAAIWVFAAR